MRNNNACHESLGEIFVKEFFTVFKTQHMDLNRTLSINGGGTTPDINFQYGVSWLSRQTSGICAENAPIFSLWMWMGVGQATPTGAVTPTNGDAACAAEGRDVISSSQQSPRPPCCSAPVAVDLAALVFVGVENLLPNTFAPPGEFTGLCRPASREERRNTWGERRDLILGGLRRVRLLSSFLKPWFKLLWLRPPS